ncbi:electron transport complex subunit RsxD [Sodalis-like symbiont of Philaenus spumarius]|nr:electron transport complex subunit RsxD [Sodalis-like symbiont of Philaenus spumarius]OZI15090.1 electron transport complex subunit RsxD [Sodalis-like symbiont of Philaenus spumarius]
MAFRIASSPFTHHRQTTQKIMIQVMLACLPGLMALTYFFGSGIIIQVVIACVTALVAEGVVLTLRRQPLASRLGDGSALLTALLLALSLPPLGPWWMMVLATVFAIIIAKQLYGGLGHNPFNPAMVGYVVLLISFPVQMTSWSPQQSLLLHPVSLTDSMALIFTGVTPAGLTLTQLRAIVDGITQATPLDGFKTSLRTNVLTAFHYRWDWQASAGWTWANISFLLGGLYLIWRRVISWHIPLSFLASMLIGAGLVHWLAQAVSAPPLLHLFSGATMLGAFFIATDPVTAAITVRGRVIFGALTGLLVWLIRTWGGYPDGVAFAVLLANICVPLIDHYTQPRAYGHR